MGYEYPCDVGQLRLAAFVAVPSVRLFWKPLVIGWPTGAAIALGVMLDDIFAGIFALLGVIALAGLVSRLDFWLNLARPSGDRAREPWRH